MQNDNTTSVRLLQPLRKRFVGQLHAHSICIMLPSRRSAGMSIPREQRQSCGDASYIRLPEKAVEYCQNYRRNLPAFARRSFDFKPSRVVRLDQQAHFALLQRRSGRGLVLWARVERLHVNHFYMSFSFQFLEVVLYF